MKTRTVVIGAVVLVIGVALLGVGAIGALSKLTISNSFTQPHPGEYVSAEIIINSTSVLVVSHPAAVGGLIHAQDLPSVTSTNEGSYAIPASTSGGSDTYRDLLGNYYYVAFGSAQPGTTIVATPINSGIIGFGLLALVGLICIVAGIVVIVVGVIQKEHRPAEGQQ
jgi:dipeptide/tripeptide permease